MLSVPAKISKTNLANEPSLIKYTGIMGHFNDKPTYMSSVLGSSLHEQYSQRELFL